VTDADDASRRITEHPAEPSPAELSPDEPAPAEPSLVVGPVEALSIPYPVVQVRANGNATLLRFAP